MSTFLKLTREVVALDWRLLSIECRTHAQDLLLLMVIGALVLAGLCNSAWTAAGVLASRPPSLAAFVVAGHVWAAWGVAAALLIVSGAHATTQRIAAHLAWHPVSRLRVFLLVQVTGLCGRSAVVTGIVALPLLFLLAGLGGTGRIVAGIGALVLALRLVPGIVRVVLFVIRALGAKELLAVAGGGVALTLALAELSLAGTVAAAMPPHAVAHLIVQADAPGPRWLTLLLWTIGVGVLDLLVLSSDAPRREARRPAVAAGALPSWIGHAARICSVSAPLLHGELLRLVRWRRFALTSIAAVAVAAVLIAAGASGPAGVLPALVPVLLCVLMIAAVMGNLFAPDRAGVQAFFLVLDRPQAALRAKIGAVAILAIAPVSATLGLLVFVAWDQLQMAHLYVPLAAAALFLWGAATGGVVSTLFPTPTDPHALGGGSLLKGAGALVATSSNLTFAAAIAGAAYLFDTGRLHPAVLAAAGIVLGAAAVAAVGLTTRAAGRVLLAQRERIMADLGTGTTVS